MSDQHNFHFCGCYGNETVSTKAIDRLAAEGTAFDNCYCSTPLCVPSRMSFLTGKTCSETNVWDNSDSLHSQIPTFAHALGIAGYRTVLVGRMHFIGEDQHHGFDERYVGDMSSLYLGLNGSADQAGPDGGIVNAVNNAGPGRGIGIEYDQAVSAEACKVIYNHDTSQDPRPLLLVVSFHSPHDPYLVYPRYYDQYKGTISLPENYNTTNHKSHPFHQTLTKQYATVTEEQMIKAREAYCGKIHLLDDLISNVLDCFDSTPLSNNKAIIYTSDHGDMMGEHGIAGKLNFFDGSSKVPLIISAPQLFPRKTRIKENVSLLDISATLAEIAGAPPLPHSSGRSLVNLLQGNHSTWPDTAYAELLELDNYGPCRMLKKGPWKLNVYSKSAPPELFHLENDPWETNNLFHDETYQQILQHLMDEICRDGWDAEKIKDNYKTRQAEKKYLTNWIQTSTVTGNDTFQWALPAPL